MKQLIESRDKMKNSNLYLEETDSKGVPLLRRIEKYPDLPEDEFIPIEYTHSTSGESLHKNYYVINKKGELKSTNTGKYLKPASYRNNYKRFNLRTEDNKYINASIHRIVASTFLVNPDSKIYDVVNHIDHDPENNSLSNLEWTTQIDNSSSKKKNSRKVSYTAINDLNEELFTVTNKNNKEFNTGLISRSIRNNKKYKGYWWKNNNYDVSPHDRYLELSKFSGDINNYIWFKHPFRAELYICKEGFIRKEGSDRILGGINDEGYIRIRHHNESLFVHRLIMEYKYGRQLEKYEVVDHINCIRYDNRLENLRLTDSKGNANNSITLNNKVKKLILADIYGNFLYYGSFNEISRLIGLVSSGRDTLLKSKFSGNKGIHYLTIELGDRDSLYDKMKNIIYIISEDGLSLSGGYTSSNEIVKYSGLPFDNSSRVSSFINSEKSILGYKLISGESAVNYLTSTLNIGNSVDFKANMTELEVDKLKRKTVSVVNPIKISEEYSSGKKKYFTNEIPIKEFDLFGNLTNIYYSREEASRQNKVNPENIIRATDGRVFISANHLWCNVGEEDKIKNDLKFIYYKFDKNRKLVNAFQSILQIQKAGIFTKTRDFYIYKNYINTGMPAPDGYYYQQGDPENMLYDPKNKDLIKKREIIRWKSNKKLNNKNNE